MASERRKYAKWKAAYIHNCLKSGQTPVAGPLATGEDQEEEHGMDQEQGQFFVINISVLGDPDRPRILIHFHFKPLFFSPDKFNILSKILKNMTLMTLIDKF